MERIYKKLEDTGGIRRIAETSTPQESKLNDLFSWKLDWSMNIDRSDSFDGALEKTTTISA